MLGQKNKEEREKKEEVRGRMWLEAEVQEKNSLIEQLKKDMKELKKENKRLEKENQDFKRFKLQEVMKQYKAGIKITPVLK